MASIIIPRRWNQQPQGLPGPSELAMQLGIGALLLPTDGGSGTSGWADALRRLWVTGGTGNRTTTSTPSGRARVSAISSAWSDYLQDRGALDPTNGYAWVVRGSLKSVIGSWGGIIARTVDNATGQGWAWQRTSVDELRIYHGAANIAAGTLSSLVDGAEHTFVGIWHKNGNRLELWVDGRLDRTATMSTAPAYTAGQGQLKVLSSRDTANIHGTIAMVGVFNRALSPGEAQIVSSNPWALFEDRSRVLYFGGDTPPNIAPQSGSVLCAGGVPGVEQSLALAPSAGTVVWAGGVPVVSQARAVQPAAGAFAWAGSAPGLAQPQAVSPSAGAAQWAGGVPGIVSGRAVAPAAGAVAWGGYAPAVAQPNGVAPTAGAVVWSGSVPGVVSGRAIAPAAGAVAWAGEAPGIAQPRTVAPSAGAVVWAGGVPTVGLANLVEPADGGIVWTGGLPGIAQAHAVSPGAGAAAWIGGVPGVEAGRAVRPAGGAASWSGHAPGIGQPRAVAPGAGAARWLGNAPYVGAINLVRPDPGAIVFAGRVPGIAQPRTVSPLPGAVRWAGGMPGIGDLLGRPEAVRAVIRERFILTVAAERRILRS